MACALCSPDLSPILASGRNWRWVLNRNQDLLGKSMLVLRRHLSSVTELTEPEWDDLHPFVRVVSRKIEEVLAPARLNYGFLGNVDEHVHLHVLPRYAEPVRFAGEHFNDPGYPGHYAVGDPNRVGDEVLAEIAGQLRLPPFEQIVSERAMIIPPRRVRPIALCVLSRGEEILVASVKMNGTDEEILRPPGGEIRFGERADSAVRREIREEVGVAITDVSLLGVLENIFVRGDEIGHENFFVFDAHVREPSFYEQAEVVIQEEIGDPVYASWIGIEALRTDTRLVVPAGLVDLVGERLAEPRDTTT